MLPLMKTRSAASKLVAFGARLKSRSVSTVSNAFMINLDWTDEFNNRRRKRVLYHSRRPDSRTEREVRVSRSLIPGSDTKNKLLVLRIAANRIEGFVSVIAAKSTPPVARRTRASPEQ